MALLFTFPGARGQASSDIAADFLYNYFNSLYKLDQNLVNGVRYYSLQDAISGSEFFLEGKASRGKITVNDKTYSNVFLKYDLVNQDIILEYNYPSGGKLQIIIDDEKVSEFEIFERTFRKYDFPSTGKQFFQIISTGDLICLIHWKKILVPVSSSLRYNYEYSEEKRKTYMLLNGQLFPFGGQKSFLKLFPDFKKEIKHFLIRYNRDIRNISYENLIRLLEYCNDLYSGNPKSADQ